MAGASRFILLLATTPFSRPSLLLRFTHRLSSSSFHHLSLSPTSRPQLIFPLKSSQQFHTHTSSSSVRDDYAGDIKGCSWPEWSKFVDTVSDGFHRNDAEDAFLVYEDLSEEFVRTATACLAFARDQPNILGSLSRRDIEVIVNNGTPFLFRNSLDIARRMRSFLECNENNVLEPENRPCTVDLMKYIISYASNPIASSESNNVYNNMELVESSVRNLLSQLAEVSYRLRETDVSSSIQYPLADSYGQSPRPVGPKIEMKRGDWICARCSFMNFARNNKCLECEDARPKRQLTGGEWECPQCDFFNYGRNSVCLRCDCKRPGEASFGTTNSNYSRPSLVYNNNGDVDSRLVANEEKAQRWFSNASDLSKAADDEDFPEIMPLRKGVNRFVVSTRKTPLERRLANSQYRGNSGSNNDPSEGKSVNRSLDEILGRTPSISNSEGKNSGTNSSSPPLSSKASGSTYAPFVPLPADMFAKKPQNSTVEIESSSNASGPTDHMKPTGEEKEQAEKSERWFKKVAELHDVTDLASAISDEDFPEIMPVRKGENRFVISKKKDRSLTSPMYKRRAALEQSGNTNFVPFVPFPPDYFSKKDKQVPEELPGVSGMDHSQRMETQQINSETWNVEVNRENSQNSGNDKVTGSSSQPVGTGNAPGSSWSGKSLEGPGVSGMDHSQRMETQRSRENTQERTINRVYATPNSQNIGNDGVTGSSSQPIGTRNLPPISQNVTQNSWNSQNSGNDNLTGSSSQPIGTGNLSGSSRWSGKSLEGSAVKEIDPLDMSEEAKAERWFRRVAQIKDISELSQIPDEDFPSIMPMRKGVNRFVVSKRKTPLERRLTSPQYRRNLPVVSSDPFKKEEGDDKS